MAKERKRLTLILEVISKDFFGVFTIQALISGKPYTFALNSEFKVEKVKSLIYRHKPGRALNLLKKENIYGNGY